MVVRSHRNSVDSDQNAALVEPDVRSEFEKAGQCRLFWDGSTRWGRPCASGIYFLRVNTPGNVRSQKLAVLR